MPNLSVINSSLHGVGKLLLLLFIYFFSLLLSSSRHLLKNKYWENFTFVQLM